MYFVRGVRADLSDGHAFRELYKARFGDYPTYDILPPLRDRFLTVAAQ